MKLNLKSIDLNLLPVFEAIMEHGQINLAAEYLGMSQPAASAALQRLRVTFKDDLFIRTRQGMLPTAKAKAMYEGIRSSLDGLRVELSPNQEFKPELCEHKFSVMGGDYFDMILLGELLTQLEHLAPLATIESSALNFDVGLELLDKGQLDLLLHYDKSLAASFPTRKLCQESLTLVMSAEHPKAHQVIDEFTFFELRHVAQPQMKSTINQLDAILGRRLNERQICARACSATSAVMAIKKAHCIGVLPRRLATLLAEHFDLLVKDFPLDSPQIDIFLSWPRFSDQEPAHQWLRELAFHCLK